MQFLGCKVTNGALYQPSYDDVLVAPELLVAMLVSGPGGSRDLAGLGTWWAVGLVTHTTSMQSGFTSLMRRTWCDLSKWLHTTLIVLWGAQGAFLQVFGRECTSQ
jgi:hypothetical protein